MAPGLSSRKLSRLDADRDRWNNPDPLEISRPLELASPGLRRLCAQSFLPCRPAVTTVMIPEQPEGLGLWIDARAYFSTDWTDVIRLGLPPSDWLEAVIVPCLGRVRCV